MLKTHIIKFYSAFIIVALFSALYVYLHQAGVINKLIDTQSLRTLIHNAGLWGPVLIIGFMAAAIVMSPIPSAPIAVTSGFLYGHGWGTVFIIIGAVSGALIAFSISRMMGYDVVQKRFGSRLNYKFLNSGKHIAVAVGVSRLIPFVSFDIVSYAAGLTKISYVQFLLATVIGITPASFLLAHLGDELSTSDLENMFYTIILLGFITLVPIIAVYLKSKTKSKFIQGKNMNNKYD